MERKTLYPICVLGVQGETRGVRISKYGQGRSKRAHMDPKRAQTPHARVHHYLDAVDVEQALLGRDEAEVDDVDKGPHLPRRRHAAHQVLLDLRHKLVDAVVGQDRRITKG